MITIIPIHEVEDIWQDIYDLYPVKNLDGYKNLKERALRGSCQLATIIINKEVVAAFAMELMDNNKTLHCGDIGGTNLNLWAEELITFLKQVAKIMGCTKIVGIAARKGWGRVLSKYVKVTSEPVRYNNEDLTAWVIGDKNG